MRLNMEEIRLQKYMADCGIASRRKCEEYILEEKVKVKETLIPYVAGCIIIFGAFTIWKVVVEVLKSAPSA